MPENTVTTVWATLTRIGFHRWPQAPAHRDYLSSRHRHVFHIRVEVPVSHDNRDVEFHDLQDLAARWWESTWPALETGGYECGTTSCEQMCHQLIAYLASAADLSVSRVDVSEDGECGATVTRQVAV